MIQLWKIQVPWSVKGESPWSNDLSIQNSMIQWSRDSKSNDPLVLICINRFQIKNVRYGDSGISQIYFYSIEAPQIIVTPIAYFSCSAMYIPQGISPSGRVSLVFQYYWTQIAATYKVKDLRINQVTKSSRTYCTVHSLNHMIPRHLYHRP